MVGHHSDKHSGKRKIYYLTWCTARGVFSGTHIIQNAQIPKDCKAK
jgi:hypothetical protein